MTQTRFSLAAMVFAAALLAPALSALAQPITVQLVYAASLQQTGPSTPPGLGQYDGKAYFIAGTTFINNPEVQRPSGGPDSFDELGNGFYEAFLWIDGSQSGLMSHLPSGTYTFSWEDVNEDTITSPLSQPYPAGLWPNQTPTYTPPTYSGLQGMNPALPFNVQVNQFVPSAGATSTLGGMYINQVVDDDYGPIMLTQFATGSGSTLTSRTIPANTLQPGQTYYLTWRFSHIIRTAGGNAIRELQFTRNTRMTFTTAPAIVCGTADFNGDGDVGTDADIEAFFACLGGDCCATCFAGGADFNDDGDVGTDADIESFFRVLGGGNC